MKIEAIFLLFIILTLNSCSQKARPDFDVNALPVDWISLTPSENGMVIFNTCDAGNLQLKIKNGKELLMHGQQEDYLFEIDEVLKIEKDTIVFKIHWKGDVKKETFKFHWKDKSKGIGIWRLLNPNVDGEFVTSEKSEQFPIVNQPCKECWPEEECD